MADSIYTYSIATNFTSLVKPSYPMPDIPTLGASIQSAAIAEALDFINISGDVVSIYFKAPLSAAEQTTLSTIVSAHTGVPAASIGVVTGGAATGSLNTAAPVVIAGLDSGSIVRSLLIDATGALKVSGQFVATSTASQGSAAPLAGAWPFQMTDGLSVLGTSAHPIKIDPTGTTVQPVSMSNSPFVGISGSVATVATVQNFPVTQSVFVGNTVPVREQGTITVTGSVGLTNVQLDATGSLKVLVVNQASSGGSSGGGGVVTQGAGNVANPWWVTGSIAVASQGLANPQLVGGQSLSQSVSLRVDRNGSPRVGFDTLQFLDTPEGINGGPLNTLLYSGTLNGMSVSVGQGSFVINNGGNTAAGKSAIVVTNKQFQLSTAYHTKLVIVGNFAYQSSSSMDFGFGAPPSNVPCAYFNVDSNGNWTANINSASSIFASVPFSSPRLNYINFYSFIIEIQDNGARFMIETLGGERLIDLTLSASGYIPESGWSVSHLPVYFRINNIGTVGGGYQAAVATINSVAVTSTDIDTGKPWADQLAGMMREANCNPLTYVQNSQLAAGAAPTLKTPVNTTVAYTTLGGEFLLTSTASSENLLGVFGFTVPVPYTLYITNIILPPYVVTTTMGATLSIHEWAVMVADRTNPSTAIGFRYPLGIYTVAASAPVGTLFTGPTLQNAYRTPIVVLPGQYFLILIKVIQGSTTGAFRGSIMVNGYFE